MGVSLDGLDAAGVRRRQELGQVNCVRDETSRRVIDILRANVFTRFNALISAMVVVVLAVGSPIDATFGIVMVFNSAIGTVQEIRAKRTLDRLRVLIAPTVEVVRDGVGSRLLSTELVLDDLIVLVAGDQVPVDAVVEASYGAEVDESALTGEADAVGKQPGDEVLSGRTMVAGRAVVRAARVGEDAWIHQLVHEAKQFDMAKSELRAGLEAVIARFETSRRHPD